MKILGMVFVWALIFVAAFIVPRFIEPTGSGFTRGMNRMPVILGMHCVGFVVAVLIAVYTTHSMSKLAKWLFVTGFAPPAVYGLMVVLLIVVYVGAIISGL